MSNRLKQILFSLILIVIAILMMPTVIKGVTTVMATANLSDYTGAGDIVKLIPLLSVVGIIIVAIVNGMYALKKND